jgi:hypothetical protein
MTVRKILLSLLLLALSLFTELALAQTVPYTAMPDSARPWGHEEAAKPQKSGAFFANLEGSMRKFNEKINKDLGTVMKQTAVRDIAPKMKAPALAIGGALALIYLLLESIQFMAGKRSSMVSVLFDIGIPCIFAVLLINNYEARIMQFDELLDVFRMATLQTDPTSQLMAMYGGVLTDVGKAIGSLFLNLIDPTTLVTAPGSWFSALADFLATLIFSLVILYLVLTGIAEVFGLVLFGPFLSAVGIAFGPLLIVGLVTPWTTDYFKKWVQFLVVSAGLTGVINVILTVATSLLGSSGMGLSELTGKGEPTAAGMIIVTVLLLTVNSLISQAPSITSALLPGSLGAHRGSGEGVKQAATKSKDHAKTATKKMGKQVGGVLKKVYQKKTD